MAFDPGMEIGKEYINDDIVKAFGCSTQGGMRRSHKTNTLVIVTNPLKGLYDDRWQDGILHYTGMGLTGDQRLINQNKTLAETHSNGVSVFLFEVFRPARYKYLGPVTLIDAPYQEEQLDANSAIRKVWVFPVKCQEVDVSSTISVVEIEERLARRVSRFERLPDDKLADIARTRQGKPSKRNTSGQIYERSIAVAEYAKRRANGQCQLCGMSAPFKGKNGKPYLEVHHIVWLSQNGDDTIENVVALCPNCHRKVHILNEADDRAVLKSAAAG